tara:strand:- start:620 stop:1024 length:405 start_codon:yes stop_codon:yes gene_type:complete
MMLGVVVEEELVVKLETEEEDLVVKLDPENQRVRNPFGIFIVIWRELSGGIGPWGAMRPLFALLLALIPFLFLGQHFNREHRKGLEWFLIQFPLVLSIVLWPVLFVWSIIDAWWVSSSIVASAQNESYLKSIRD